MPRTCPSIRRRRSSTSDWDWPPIGRDTAVSSMLNPCYENKEQRTTNKWISPLFFVLCSLPWSLARQRLVEGILQDSLRRSSLDALDHLAVLEDDHRRDRHDPELARPDRVIVDVQLRYGQLPIVLAR